ncbi:MAG: hypothetical protein AB7V62_13440 [Thermoleophilia bacterium]
MPTLRTTSSRLGPFLAAGVAVAAAAAVTASGATSPSMPAGPPSDAAAAGMTVINRTISPAPTTNRGFDGFQTVTIAAPKGKVVLQGFATLAGGNAGSVIITSTSATPKRYQVKLRFPGEQGRPGKLHVRVQLLPVAG